MFLRDIFLLWMVVVVLVTEKKLVSGSLLQII